MMTFDILNNDILAQCPTSSYFSLQKVFNVSFIIIFLKSVKASNIRKSDSDAANAEGYH